MVGNSKYIALGGKFSRASGSRSKGWPEWPIPSIASNKVGPVGGPSAIGLATDPRTDGRVAMAWNQLWDRDNLKLTYEFTRDNTVISKRAAPVPFWERSTMSFIDADSESSHSSAAATYRVTASAPDGNTVVSSTVRVRPVG